MLLVCCEHSDGDVAVYVNIEVLVEELDGCLLLLGGELGILGDSYHLCKLYATQ